MDGMEEVKERNFRGAGRMASGELGRRRRASRELKWVGAYSEARPDGPSSQCEEELVLCQRCWLAGPAGCAGPTFPDTLTIAAGSRISLPTPSSVALSVACLKRRPVSHFVTAFNNYGQNARGVAPSPPQPMLRDFLASALPHGNPPVASPRALSPPPLAPLAPSGPVWEERGGRRRFKPISSELVRHMSAGVHFSRFATPEMLCAWLGPCTHATSTRTRRSGHSMPPASLVLLMHLSVAKLTCPGHLDASLREASPHTQALCPLPTACIMPSGVLWTGRL